MKPQLAEDADLDKLPYPVLAQPKIDGVRAMHITGQLTGRSLDAFKGFGITEYFSKPEFAWLDGEMTLGDNPKSLARLCSLTTGAMGKFKDVTEMPDLHWWVFDYLAAPAQVYQDRYADLVRKVRELKHPRIHLVPYTLNILNKVDAEYVISEHLDEGYEGTIFRNPRAIYKPGRSDKLQQLTRSKPWQDDEMLCTGIEEGDRNENEAKTNTLGRTERSSAKAGKVPNGLVGNLKGELLKDIVSAVTGQTLFPKGLPITIGAGELDAKERKYYFDHPEEIVDHIVKFKHLAYGVKDLPRMGTYLSHRLPQDWSK